MKAIWQRLTAGGGGITQVASCGRGLWCSASRENEASSTPMFQHLTSQAANFESLHDQLVIMCACCVIGDPNSYWFS